MNLHRQRLEAALRGEIIDRPPVALWRHFPVDDQTPESLAAATLHWQAAYGWDLVKVTPASSFCLKDWGAEDVWEGAAEGTRRYTKRIISAPGDWATLKVLDANSPHLAAQLKCLRILRERLPASEPLIQTIFSPMSQAKNLAGGERLILHLRQHPQLVQRGLAIIAETTRRFIKAAIETGIDGIFFAVQHAQAGLLTKGEFATFGRAYDLPVLEAANPLWFNMAHLHGHNVYFDAVADYPVQVLNWHDRDTAPDLAEGQKRFSGITCGGMRRETLALGSPAEIRAEIEDALSQTGGKRFLLGTGCVVETIAPHGNLDTVSQS
ncbi:MAG: uroporphyrinogen decarboxylase [Anaerolineae bacterium]|nr:uroporphyrinogen decarboxylase [Anaerolineae bacterium]